jgi:lysophospholipase L1-like esterase
MEDIMTRTLLTWPIALVIAQVVAGGCGGGPGASVRPARLVVLGDSIAACMNVGGPSGAGCGPRLLADYLRTTYAPMLEYENRAVGGAVTTDVPARQLALVAGGPGHVLVLVYVGGNDLSRQLLATDQAAIAGVTGALPAINDAWDQIAAYFGDRGRFPDGYTLIMNNQYDPFDDCTAPPFFLSAMKIELLHTFNQTLQDIATRTGAHLTDQFTPFLGHGHHYDVASCPHYQPGAAPWMSDLIHPNGAGHEDLFQQWKVVVDRLYQ